MLSHLNYYTNIGNYTKKYTPSLQRPITALVNLQGPSPIVNYALFRLFSNSYSFIIIVLNIICKHLLYSPSSGKKILRQK